MTFWRWIDRLEGGLASVGAGLCLFLIMMITVIGVFGRYVLGMDLIPGGYNMIERIAFPLLVFWAVPLGHRQGSFPRFDVLTERLPAALSRALTALVLIVEIAVFMILFWYLARFAWEATLSAREMQIGTRLWPVWPVMLMMPLAFGLMLLEMFRLLWKALRGGESGKTGLASGR
ncbi:TRAP transporter small permease [Alloalcanivorax mobilis]|uniref:TRAP transporter small permease n=1 Tax=Alloalcanivorax mobilis TaxID=2019569 RepID=UPI000B5B30FB|nr:TRAP transporter small permease [Alloalcanivorax mobilis]ASK35647.1 C4-dicarboxylate ABC transporter substrate-binding protein [Alcanivorax sp. N3-2A]|tara:strand:- start:3301 stop:3825 length:525 start_codon:yes stop_codon:yes gene_type:complete